MTDEEKAEEYVVGKAHEHYHFLFEENNGSPADFAKLCYLDGLAEGRKELEQWKQEWQDAQIKANEEGFARTTLQIKYSELKEENAELKAQIEKMKNVGNCKHAMTCAKWNEKQSCLGMMKFCGNCKDWELAE